MPSFRVLLHDADGCVTTLHIPVHELRHWSLERLMRAARSCGVLQSHSPRGQAHAAASPVPASTELQYRDDEGEWIALRSERDMKGMIRMVTGAEREVEQRRTRAPAGGRTEAKAARRGWWGKASPAPTTTSLHTVSPADGDEGGMVEVHDVAEETELCIRVAPELSSSPPLLSPALERAFEEHASLSDSTERLEPQMTASTQQATMWTSAAARAPMLAAATPQASKEQAVLDESAQDSHLPEDINGGEQLAERRDSLSGSSSFVLVDESAAAPEPQTPSPAQPHKPASLQPQQSQKQLSHSVQSFQQDVSACMNDVAHCAHDLSLLVSSTLRSLTVLAPAGVWCLLLFLLVAMVAAPFANPPPPWEDSLNGVSVRGGEWDQAAQTQAPSSPQSSMHAELLAAKQREREARLANRIYELERTNDFMERKMKLLGVQLELEREEAAEEKGGGWAHVAHFVGDLTADALSEKAMAAGHWLYEANLRASCWLYNHMHPRGAGNAWLLLPMEEEQGGSQRALGHSEAGAAVPPELTLEWEEICKPDGSVLPPVERPRAQNSHAQRRA